MIPWSVKVVETFGPGRVTANGAGVEGNSGAPVRPSRPALENTTRVRAESRDSPGTRIDIVPIPNGSVVSDRTVGSPGIAHTMKRAGLGPAGGASIDTVTGV